MQLMVEKLKALFILPFSLQIKKIFPRGLIIPFLDVSHKLENQIALKGAEPDIYCKKTEPVRDNYLETACTNLPLWWLARLYINFKISLNI